MGDVLRAPVERFVAELTPAVAAQSGGPLGGVAAADGVAVPGDEIGGGVEVAGRQAERLGGFVVELAQGGLLGLPGGGAALAA